MINTNRQLKQVYNNQGWIQDFKLGGAHLKKLRRAEGGAKIFGVFRVKNHDFTPKKIIFFSNFRGGGGGGGRWMRPSLDPPLIMDIRKETTIESFPPEVHMNKLSNLNEIVKDKTLGSIYLT